MKGLSSKDHPMYGRKHSEESKIKMSKSSKGKPSSFKGKKHNASSNEKNRQAHLGKKASDETRRRQREAAKRRKKPSKATGTKISQALKGKKKSKAHRDALSKAMKGRTPWNKNKKHPKTWVVKPASASSKRKNRRAHLGKRDSQKTKRKKSKAQKGKHVGKLNPQYGKHQSKKTKSKRRKTMREKYPHGYKMSKVGKKKIAEKYKPQKPSKNTKIEKIIQKLCRQKKIKYQSQKRFEFKVPPPYYHSVDLFIQPNVCVECDGDRFHANPKKYAPNDIIYRAYKSKHHHRKKPLRAKQIWKKDKHITQELRKQGNRVIRLWGSEINSNPEKCLQKIIKIIKESRRQRG